MVKQRGGNFSAMAGSSCCPDPLIQHASLVSTTKQVWCSQLTSESAERSCLHNNVDKGQVTKAGRRGACANSMLPVIAACMQLHVTRCYNSNVQRCPAAKNSAHLGVLVHSPW